MSVFVPGDAVLVADGGLVTELEVRGNDLSDSLRSARLLMDAPEEILDAHLPFFRAGPRSRRRRVIRHPSRGSRGESLAAVRRPG